MRPVFQPPWLVKPGGGAGTLPGTTGDGTACGGLTLDAGGAPVTDERGTGTYCGAPPWG